MFYPLKFFAQCKDASLPPSLLFYPSPPKKNPTPQTHQNLSMTSFASFALPNFNLYKLANNCINLWLISVIALLLVG